MECPAAHSRHMRGNASLTAGADPNASRNISAPIHGCQDVRCKDRVVVDLRDKQDQICSLNLYNFQFKK